MHAVGMRVSNAWNLLAVGAFVSMNVSFLLHGTFVIDSTGSTTVGNLQLDCTESNASRIAMVSNTTIPPLSTTTTTTTTTSACLYIMDDNHYLIEWLAYHYHVMNLRNLILTTDPHSLTSPEKILDRWKDRMSIVLWTNDDFLPSNIDEKVHDIAFDDEGVQRKNVELVYHRARQAAFNLECLKEHKRQDRGWTMVIDVDEYMTFNPSLLNIDPEDDEWELDWIVPPVDEVGSVATILQNLMLPNPDYEDLHSPCVPVYRRQFSAHESPQQEVNIMAPRGFDGKNFQTLRWRRYGAENDQYNTKVNITCNIHREVPNKVIVDLGRLRLVDLDHPVNKGNPHTPLESICPKEIYLGVDDTPLMVNHYMGTMEQWLYRSGDKRGKGYRIARYEDLNTRLGTKSTDQVSRWLHGFVKSLGHNEASRLLEGVGILEPLPKQPVETGQKSAKEDTHEGEARPLYKVGDVVQANYKGDGYWSWAEVTAVHSYGFYNVIFLADCSEEIATFEERLRLTGDTDDATEFNVDVQQLALASGSTKAEQER